MAGTINIRMLADVKGFQYAMRRARSTTEKFGIVASRVAKASALALGASLVILGRRAISVAADMEVLDTSFTTLLGSAAESKKTIKDLTDFTARTPFRLEGVAGAAKQLIAAGVNTQNLQKELKMLGDLAAVTNVPLGDMAQIYSKAMNKGKLQAEELNQLAERGIPIMKELSDMYGVTKKEIFDMAAKGKIGFEDLNVAMQRMTSQGGIAYGAMKELSKTTIGLNSTFQDNLNLVLADLGEKILPIANHGLSKMIGYLGAIRGENIRDLKKSERELSLAFQESVERLKEREEAYGKNNSRTVAMRAQMHALAARLNSVRQSIKDLTESQGENTEETDNSAAAWEAFSKKLEKAVDTVEEVKKKLSGPILTQDRGKVLFELKPMAVDDLQLMPEIDEDTTGIDTIKAKVDELNQAWSNVGQTLSVIGEGLKTIAMLQDTMNQNNINALNAQHETEREIFENKYKGASDYSERLDALQKKQAEERNKELKKQANIQKQMAIFSALLAIPEAYLKGLTQGGLPLAKLYATLAGVQAGAISAVKPPSFAIGTTSFAGGVARVHQGEDIYLPTGTEIKSKGMKDKGDYRSLSFEMDAGRFLVGLDRTRRRNYHSI